MLIVITGASSGIGRAAARALAERGHELAIVGRNPFRTHEVARETGGTAFLADFDRLADVRQLAHELLAAYPRIDALGNNAGGIIAKRGLSADGVERTWQHNVLAPFVLTQALLPRLVESAARVVFTGSEANRWARVDAANPDRTGRAWLRGAPAYGAAKRADIMLARELARREPALQVNSFHPGAVATGFGRLDAGPLSAVIARVLRSPERGAQSLIGLLEGTVDAASGSYVDDDKRDRGVAKQALDPAECAKLWNALEKQAAELEAR
jgi:NAD(P)-dependent dehydrogenase (short-subunit alcohol dehydrogenase family)